ncbi:FtsX-like permease family protein [Isoptericola sp. NPDC057559]|uniref:FtsX-like permease family protein n=1 Tax=Isoptericola sp. NPDC057559 TaxID=3346168 RepID=UPI0036A655A4
MTATVALGLRLARAGGPLRGWSIATGNAVGVTLLLVALALPVAIHPDPVARALARVQLLGIDLFLLLPAIVLLVTVGRLSSGVRDRRLGALRMIGVTPRRVRAVAAVENGVLALAGSVVGAVLTVLAAPVAGRAVVDDPAWLAQPLEISWGAAGAVAAAVIALSVVVGTGATWNRELPGRARSEAVARVPRPWRLVVLALGLGLLGLLAAAEPGSLTGIDTFLLLAGAAVTAVGIALVTPLVTSWVARVLVRSRGVVAVLAGRSVQVDAAGASRVVAGLGAATFLAIGALAVIGAFESTPQYRYALQSVEDGPQKIWLDATNLDEDPDATLDPVALRALDDVPGVLGVMPRSDASYVCNPEVESCGEVFVGTCAELSLVVEQSGCVDGRPARLAADRPDSEIWTDLPRAGSPSLVEPFTLQVRAPAERAFEIRPSSPIVVDVAAQTDRWVYGRPDYTVFVPPALAGVAGEGLRRADVVAEGGVDVQDLVVAWAEENGYAAWPYPMDDVASVDRVRAAVVALVGLAVGVGLLVLALTATDRAVERRRAVARQVMVGVPGGVLRSGQLVQVLVPVAVSAALGAGCGLVLAGAYARLAGLDDLLGPGRWGIAVALVVGGGVLVAVATVPLIRTRITPELLRRE